MIIDNDFVCQRCPLCGFHFLEKLGDITYGQPLIFSSKEITLKNKPELWKCKRCKSGFTQNAIPEREAARLYGIGEGGERWVSKPFGEEKTKEVIRALEEVFTPGRRILDVGCNTGELLDFARSKSGITAGVEYSTASKKIVELKGHTCFPSLDEVVGQYDVITAFDLVEHLYDIKSFLMTCHKLLSDNGVIVIMTGTISCLGSQIAGSNWWYVKFPEHIMFPSKRFFQEIPGFFVISSVRTYASTKFIASIRDRIFTLAKGIQHGGYTALPSLMPDHLLLIIKKCEIV